MRTVTAAYRPAIEATIDDPAVFALQHLATAACANRNAPVRLTSITFCHLSSGMSPARAPQERRVVHEDVETS
jgi:hypothetical protein